MKKEEERKIRSQIKTSYLRLKLILSEINFNKIFNLFNFYVKIMYIFDE
jgi:hypothetical protein